MMYLHI